MTERKQSPSKIKDLLIKYVASGHMIISILKKNNFLSICTGVSSTLHTTLVENDAITRPSKLEKLHEAIDGGWRLTPSHLSSASRDLTLIFDLMS